MSELIKCPFIPYIDIIIDIISISILIGRTSEALVPGCVLPQVLHNHEDLVRTPSNQESLQGFTRFGSEKVHHMIGGAHK